MSQTILILRILVLFQKNSLQDYIGDISSKLPREKLSKEDSVAPTFKSCYREYYKLSFSDSLQM